METAVAMADSWAVTACGSSCFSAAVAAVLVQDSDLADAAAAVEVAVAQDLDAKHSIGFT